MIKTLYSTKDTTLYQASESANTSKDEILEITKYVSSSFGDLAVSRPIMYFNTTNISASLAAKGVVTASSNGNLKYFLKLFISEEQDIKKDYSLIVHPLTSTWEGGTGRSTHLPLTTDGAGWKNRDSETAATAWSTPGGDFTSGGNVSESAVQTFTDTQGDIELDITSMVESWHTGITNNGIIIKRSGSEESDSSIQGSLYYYSRNTNTIYSPRLEVRYGGGSHGFTNVTGSEITMTEDVDVQPRLRPEYKQDSQERVFVNTSVRGGARSQAGSVGQASIRYLPQSSSYAIIDNATGEYVYKHDKDYTYIERKTTSGKHQQYFDLDMNGLFPERYYVVEFKVNHYDAANLVATRYYKSNTLFKVVK